MMKMGLVKSLVLAWLIIQGLKFLGKRLQRWYLDRKAKARPSKKSL